MSKEKSKKDNLRQYSVALACGGLALVLVLAILFRYSGLDEVREQRKKLQADALATERNIRNAAHLEEHLKSLQAGVAKLGTMLINFDDVSGNQAYFYRLEGNTGVHLTPVPGAAPAKDYPEAGAFRPGAFKVVATGQFRQTLAFLRALEHGERLYALQDFSLLRGAGSGGDSQGAVTLTLNLQLLARKP